MKILIKFLVFSFLISNTVFCQTIENDWANFRSENWKVKYIADKSEYAGIQTQGRLIFENLKNKLFVTFYVFSKIEVDDKFHQKINNFITKVNCNRDIDEKAIHSFFMGEYYYMVSFCRVCFVRESNDCKVLSKSLKKYTEE